MKFSVVNKSTTVNRFVLHTLLRNITHLAVILQKTNIKLDILKGGGKVEKSPVYESFRYRTTKDLCAVQMTSNLLLHQPTNDVFANLLNKFYS